MPSYKPYSHACLAMVLVIVAITISALTYSKSGVKELDFARLYTMKWERGDATAAKTYLDASRWPDEACQAVTDLSAAGNADCLAKRKAIRDGILVSMKCHQYSSQTCSYLRQVLGAVARNSTTERVGGAGTAFKVVGKNIKGKCVFDHTWQDVLRNVIEDAPKVFHGAYRAEQSSSTLVLRSDLYILITIVVLANILMQILDSWTGDYEKLRPYVRVGTFVLVFITSMIFFTMNTGTAFVFWMILGSSFISLAYFEMFLDETIVRPWYAFNYGPCLVAPLSDTHASRRIHPFVFSVIYQSLAMLALVENGILDYHIIVVHMLLSMCASQQFMSVVWYYVGIKEKLGLPEGSPERILHVTYEGKEVQWGLAGALALQLVIPLQQALSPYDYTLNSLFLAFAPFTFAVLALLCTFVVQDMTLDDDYSDTPSASQKSRPATALTGGKLLVSLLLLVFATAVLIVYFNEHLSTYRAYLDVMPESSIQYDPVMDSRKFLIGPGLSTAAWL